MAWKLMLPDHDQGPAGKVGLVRRVAALPVQACVVVLALPTFVVTVTADLARDLSAARIRAQLLLARATALLTTVEALVADISATAGHAAQVVHSAETVAAGAGRVVEDADAQLGRTAVLLEGYAPVLAHLQPLAAEAGQKPHARHVSAVAELLELLPEMIDLIVPALRGMGDLSPELGELAQRFDAVGQIVEGLPGAGLLRRRGAEGTTEAPAAG